MNKSEKLEEYKMRKFLELIYRSLGKKSEITPKKGKIEDGFFGGYHPEKGEMMFYNHCVLLEEKLEKQKKIEFKDLKYFLVKNLGENEKKKNFWETSKKQNYFGFEEKKSKIHFYEKKHKIKKEEKIPNQNNYFQKKKLKELILPKEKEIIKKAPNFKKKSKITENFQEIIFKIWFNKKKLKSSELIDALSLSSNYIDQKNTRKFSKHNNYVNTSKNNYFSNFEFQNLDEISKFYFLYNQQNFNYGMPLITSMPFSHKKIHNYRTYLEQKKNKKNSIVKI